MTRSFVESKLLRPMALFARTARRNQAIGFHGRLNRVAHAPEDHVQQLPCTGHLTMHPPGRTWGDMAIHAKNIGMRRVLMCGELRFHDMATLAAELGRLHMLDGAVSALGPDYDIDCRS